MDEKIKSLKIKNSRELSSFLRFESIKMSHNSKAAHLASSLSCIDIMSVLFFSILNFSNRNKKNINRDRFILSKGHAATALYGALYYKGIITKNEILNYTKKGSLLEEHPNPKLHGVEAATGSLGHGLSISCGIALGAKLKNKKFKTYVLLSDGECNEGSVWESCLFANANNLDNLIAIIDYNKWQATGKTQDILKLGSLTEKFKSFGWNTYEINGHDHKEILQKLKLAKSNKNNPSVIIANTTKGKGISFMENDNNWHYRSPSYEELLKAKKELKIL